MFTTLQHSESPYSKNDDREYQTILQIAVLKFAAKVIDNCELELYPVTYVCNIKRYIKC